MKKHTQAGNVLVYILIAVALLAALSFSFMRTSRAPGSVPPERAKIAALDIIRYARSVEDAVKQVMLVNGCSEQEISFENNVVAGYDGNTFAPGDERCNIFSINGGGLTWKDLDDGLLIPQADAAVLTYAAGTYGQFHFPSGLVCVQGIGRSGGICGNDAATKDIVMGVMYLDENVCEAINRELDVTVTAGNHNCSPAGTTAQWDGTFSNVAHETCGALNDGMKAACTATSTRSGNTFHYVLVSR